MQDISTQALDAYTQHILSDRTMSHTERARHAAVAITSHVMQEFRLPMDTELPVDEDEVDTLIWGLDHKANDFDDALMQQCREAFKAIAFVPENVSAQKLQDSLTAGILYIPEGVSFDKENWHPTVVLPEVGTEEGS